MSVQLAKSVENYFERLITSNQLEIE